MSKWTWTDKEDDYLYKHGTCIAVAAGRTKAIQQFVEALSNRINSKCDFAFAAGRAHIDVHPKYATAAAEAVTDTTFTNQFLVPYSNESYENETYFELLK